MLLRYKDRDAARARRCLMGFHLDRKVGLSVHGRTDRAVGRRLASHWIYHAVLDQDANRRLEPPVA